MLGTQTRTQKSKAAPKAAGRSVAAAAKSKKGESEVRPASSPVAVLVPVVSEREREMLIAQAAYFRAEKRGFAPGGELQDWIEAEAEVLLAAGRV